MVSISKIPSQVIGGATNIKPMKWLANRFNVNEEQALAMTAVTSIIIKDGVGCAMYVKQSLNNDKIPEKKRKFVAALDLTNGLLMIGAQIALFFAMRKFSEPLFDKIFNKSFNPQTKRFISSRLRMMQTKAGEESSRKLEIDKVFNKEVRKDGLDLFKFIADIAAATIIGKRIVVPFIATPLASKVEKWMNSKNTFGSTAQDSENKQQTPDSTQPLATMTSVRGVHPTWFKSRIK